MYQESYFQVQRQQSSPMAPSPEPMVMTSPSSPNIPHPQGHSAYLPGYLLGDPPSGVSSPSHGRLWSSGTASSGTPGVKPSGSNQSMSSPFGHGCLSRSLLDAKPELSASQRGNVKGKSSGPPIPIQGLLESSFSNKSICNTPLDRKPPKLGAIFSTPNAASGANESVHHLSQSTPAVNSTRCFNSSSVHFDQISPPQVDPFYTQGDSLSSDDLLDDTWVTVFGFPKGSAHYVHAQFSQYGTIVKHEVSNEGNWMHVHYRTSMQARKALSKNGKIIGNNIMVGVRQCIDKKVMGMTSPSVDHSGQQEMRQASLYDSPNGQPSTIGEQLTGTPRLGTPIRPLTAAYKASAAERQVEPDNSVLQKQEGIVSKAMEYLFGW